MKKFTILLFMLSKLLAAQNLSWTNIDLKINTNIRGLSVVNDKIVWVSGSNGWTGRSMNGGKNWTMNQVNGFEKADFRSLYAFNDKKAIIANSGSPAHILMTQDGGLSWHNVYSNNDSAAFFDGIDFWDEHDGLLYGDPLNGKMLLLRTKDGGLHWQELPDSSRPVLIENEASFAASGTGIRCIEKQKIILTSGGSQSRLFISNNQGATWDSISTPMIHGRNSTGVFSVAYKKPNQLIIVGGDFLHDTSKINHVFYSTDGGQHWLRPEVPTGGYRECVEYINKKTFLATGPFGTDVSYDNGKNWAPLSDEKFFHVIRKARKGTLMMAAGRGKVSILKSKSLFP